MCSCNQPQTMPMPIEPMTKERIIENELMRLHGYQDEVRSGTFGVPVKEVSGEMKAWARERIKEIQEQVLTNL